MLKNLTMQRFIETHNDVLSTLQLLFSSTHSGPGYMFTGEIY